MQNFKAQLVVFIKRTGTDFYTMSGNSSSSVYSRKAIDDCFEKLKQLPSNTILFQEDSFEMIEEGDKVIIQATSKLENFGGQMPIPEFMPLGIRIKN